MRIPSISLVGSQIDVKVINKSIWEGIQVAVKVNSFLLAQIFSYEAQWRSQDVQVTWAQHGHTQCVNTHLLRDLGNTPAMKTF